MATTTTSSCTVCGGTTSRRQFCPLSGISGTKRTSSTSLSPVMESPSPPTRWCSPPAAHTSDICLRLVKAVRYFQISCSNRHPTYFSPELIMNVCSFPVRRPFWNMKLLAHSFVIHRFDPAVSGFRFPFQPKFFSSNFLDLSTLAGRFLFFFFKPVISFLRIFQSHYNNSGNLDRSILTQQHPGSCFDLHFGQLFSRRIFLTYQFFSGRFLIQKLVV